MWLSPLAEFSLRPSLATRISETVVHVGIVGPRLMGDPQEYWFRKTTRFFEGGARVEWTDTRSCPAARGIIADMRALEMPRPAPDGSIEVRADGVRYSLTTRGIFGRGRDARITIGSAGGTPLADWADRSLEGLEACWTELERSDIRYRSTTDQLWQLMN